MILFPSHPSFPKQPDPSFEEEIEAAKDAGFKIGFVDVDQGIFVHSRILCLYRGWIVKPVWYHDLYVQEPKLIVSPSEYNHSYNFPEWYEVVRQCIPSTPKSVWFPGTANDLLNGTLMSMRELNNLRGPIFIKDWCKSRKHEWADCCYIPSLSDADNLRRVITNFITRQEEDGSFAGGLVFREYIKFKPIGVHPESGLPLINEHRFFVFKGQIFCSAPYWNEGWYTEGLGIDELPDYPDKKVIIDLVPHIKSNFFAIDVAQKEDGDWMVIEVNDGGTAEPPGGAGGGNVSEFYKALRELF
jgi:hypothetical protein